MRCAPPPGSTHRLRALLHVARKGVIFGRETGVTVQCELTTWASTSMTRSRGRSGKGQRLNVGIPHGHWKTTTFVAGPRLDGMVGPMVLDGPINRKAFIAYGEQILGPDFAPPRHCHHG